jgi:hypothetical protein
MNRPNLSRALILLMLLTSLTQGPVAQTLTSATIVGTVSDSSGAVVPHATVRITQTDTEVGTARARKRCHGPRAQL